MLKYSEYVILEREFIMNVLKKYFKQNIDCNKNIRKILLIAFILNIIQLSLLIILIIYGGESNKFSMHTSEAYYLMYAITILIIFNVIITLILYCFIFHKRNDEIIKETLNNIENLNRKLREQRHDYLNHIQVIYGLLELEEFEEAKNYIEPVYKDIVKVSKVLRTAHPAINALLQAKIQMAEKYNIDMCIEVKSNLDKISIEPWEFCKVLSNIIDNGVQALIGKEKNRKLNIDIREDKKDYYISIFNNGPKISKENLNNIFNEGFTTKKETGHGVGLFIVNNIIKEANGDIYVSSNEGKTSFNILIPKFKK